MVICSTAHAIARTRPYCATRLCTCAQSIGMTVPCARPCPAKAIKSAKITNSTASHRPSLTTGIDDGMPCNAPLMHARRVAT